MTWVMWRQHRNQTLVTAIVLVAFAVVVVLTGVHMADTYREAAGRCGSSPTCGLLNRLFDGDGAIIDIVHLTIVVPILLGLFVGATLVGRETEHATHVLVWTQSVTRRRWLYTKVTVALAGSAMIAAAVSILVTWWSNTLNSLHGDRFQGAQFDTQNLMPVAFTLFAVALGIAAGCLIRRILPALATTLGGFVAVRLLVGIYLRPHYLGAVTRTYPLGADAIPSGSWTLRAQVADAAGRVLGPRSTMPDACASTTRQSIDACLSRLGYHDVITLHPPSHYWPFQLIESGIYVGLAAVLVAVAVVFTLRHDA